MSDYKGGYSSTSTNYVNNIVPFSEKALKEYTLSKKREDKYNDSWSKTKVNINDIVEKFAPNSNTYVQGYKYIFDGAHYEVVADMAAGYLRIIDKYTNQPVKLNGKPGSNEETHFKILKRGEM